MPSAALTAAAYLFEPLHLMLLLHCLAAHSSDYIHLHLLHQFMETFGYGHFPFAATLN